jgi:hypothetical protein
MNYGKIENSNGVSVDQSLMKDGYLQLTQIATPTAPASGKTIYYTKSDGKLYKIVNGGSETEVGASGGYKTLYVPASQITPRSDSGATPNYYESPTYKIHFETLDFDPDVAQYSQFNVIMPEDWDRGTVKVKFSWMADTGTGNVVWCIQSQALTDSDAIDATYGTAVTVTDNLTTLLDIQLSDATEAMTVAATPALDDMICFQVYRDKPNQASDTFTGNARLISVFIQYNATLTPTAW